MPKDKKGMCCSQCKAKSVELHADAGSMYCTVCWEAYYGAGSAPSKPRGAPSLAAFLPQELSHESGAGEHDPNRPVASAEAADRASEFVEGTYIVNGTRGGGIPVEIEKRSKGKKVTVVSNIQGDSEALAKALSKALGCGGTSTPGNVAIQGERVAQVSTYLAKSGCLRGVSAAIIVAAGGTPKNATATHAPARESAPQAQATASLPTDLPQIEVKVLKWMKPAELKALFKTHGISTQGNKVELLARAIEVFGPRP